MSLRQERLKHEIAKRRIEGELEIAIGQISRDESFVHLMIQLVVAGAFVVIALVVAPDPLAIDGGIVFAVLVGIAAIAAAWGFGVMTTRAIEKANQQYRKKENAEDKRYLKTIP